VRIVTLDYSFNLLLLLIKKHIKTFKRERCWDEKLLIVEKQSKQGRVV
jgi:hypothetical protein